MSLSNSRIFDPNLNNRTEFGTPGPQGPQGPVGPQGPPGPSIPMQPFTEGVAFGETSTGRTLLGYGVDAGSNNVGLWCSSTGSPQNPCNSGSSITAFWDTNTSDAVMLDGIYLGAGGSIKSSNLSNSLFMQRNSTVNAVSDFTRNLMLLNDFTANPGDTISRSLALMTGQFSTDSIWDQSLLIGDMTGVDSPGVFDALCLRTPGSTQNLTMAKNTGYIGNGQYSYVMNPSEFLIETYNNYYLKTLRADATSGQIAYYEPGSGELTYGPPSAPILASSGIISSAWFPAVYNPTTNVLAYTSSNRISRVYRNQGITDINGTITFNPGGLIVVNTAGNSIQATVASTSTTVAYTCQISNIISGTFTIQVFQSTNAVLGSPSMIRSGAGLVVHVTLSY